LTDTPCPPRPELPPSQAQARRSGRVRAVTLMFDHRVDWIDDATIASCEQARAALHLRDGQPVVAMDYDGVVNALSRPAPRGFRAERVHVDRANWPTSRFHGQLPKGTDDPGHEVVVNRKHGRAVRHWLHLGAAVVWATTWERAVLRHAHLSRIPELPVIEFSRLMPNPAMANYRNCPQWKIVTMQYVLYGHPVAWIDDMAGAWTATDRWFRPDDRDHEASFRAIVPIDYLGMQESDADEVTEFIRQVRR
jgi:hypothetical protein